MKTVKFEYDKNTSLTVIVNEGWWFSLENSVSSSSPLIDPVDDDPFMDLVVNSNGNSNGGK